MTTALPSSPTKIETKLMSVYARLMVVPILWGGTFIAGRIVSAEVSPATASLVRFLFAALALLISLHLSEGLRALRSLNSKQLLGTAALGATGILAYNLCFFNALALIPASRSSLFVALNPVLTVLVAVIFLDDRMSLSRWLGMGLALLGVWIVITRGDLSQLLQAVGRGELFMLGAISSWAAYTLIGRKLLQGMSPLLSTTCAVLWGCLMLAVLALFESPKLSITLWSFKAWLSLAFLGVLGTAVAFVWYYEGIRRLGAARTVVFNNLVPIFGVLLAWLLLNEPLSWSLALGGAIAVSGVFLVNRQTS
ncbi:DMT family transporter [Variovorax sp. PCZ-1]|uniref:DMT family transporter n=1 Tax=Variovorax sp. PCZ-1 TaxID=2835533 RepID=UPI001BCB4452|nr:DMT family transporter [Variovorax sp. PCZ-1]MBS7806935.1 DMT family transporter [Variovorax sp. PCZ-1]